MLFFIIKWFILYLLLIIITHYLYLFFEKNLTSTKTKDFIGFSNSEYNKINKILETNNNNSINTNNNNINTNNNNINNSINDVTNTITNNKTNIMDFKSDKFDLNSFNSIFETNNFSQENNNNSISMAGDLDEFLNKLNSK
tara:strand:+ start:36 stop:458 length:423 start_codon:yes stop_codon:yes gene_type:complete